PVPRPELWGAAQMARPDQVDELEEVIEPVLDRRGGEQQQYPARSDLARRAGAPRVLFNLCASPTTTRSPGTPPSSSRSPPRRAVATDTITIGASHGRADWFQAWLPCATAGSPNLRSSSSHHCSTSPAGTMISVR